MVSYSVRTIFRVFQTGVLILVVVDDGLVPRQEGGMGYVPGVLILVVVDDGLVLFINNSEVSSETKS